MHGILSTVPGKDLLDPLLRRRQLSARSHHEVKQREGIEVDRGRQRQLAELVEKASLVGLGPGTRMVGDERNNPRRDAVVLKEPSAVQRMKARSCERWRVAQIMEPCGSRNLSGDETPIGEGLCQSTDPLDVPPPRTKEAQPIGC